MSGMDNPAYVFESSTSFMPALVQAGEMHVYPAVSDVFFVSSSSIAQVRMLSKWSGFGSAEVTSHSFLESYSQDAQQFKVCSSKRSVDQRVSKVLVQPTVSSLEDTYAAKVRQQLDLLYNVDLAAVVDPANNRAALRVVVDLVEDLAEQEDFQSLDVALKLFDPASLRKITSVSMLRSCFKYRNKLGNWDLLYGRTWRHLEETKQDPAHALRGLPRSRMPQFA